MKCGSTNDELPIESLLSEMKGDAWSADPEPSGELCMTLSDRRTLGLVAGKTADGEAPASSVRRSASAGRRRCARGRLTTTAPKQTSRNRRESAVRFDVDHDVVMPEYGDAVSANQDSFRTCD